MISCYGVQLSECDVRCVTNSSINLNPFCNARVREFQAPERPPLKHFMEEQFGDRAQVLRSALRCGLACRLLHLGQIDLIDMSKEPGCLFKYILNCQDIGTSSNAPKVQSAPWCDIGAAMVAA